MVAAAPELAGPVSSAEYLLSWGRVVGRLGGGGGKSSEEDL